MLKISINEMNGLGIVWTSKVTLVRPRPTRMNI